MSWDVTVILEIKWRCNLYHPIMHETTLPTHIRQTDIWIAMRKYTIPMSKKNPFVFWSFHKKIVLQMNSYFLANFHLSWILVPTVGIYNVFITRQVSAINILDPQEKEKYLNLVLKPFCTEIPTYCPVSLFNRPMTFNYYGSFNRLCCYYCTMHPHSLKRNYNSQNVPNVEETLKQRVEIGVRSQ